MAYLRGMENNDTFPHGAEEIKQMEAKADYALNYDLADTLEERVKQMAWYCQTYIDSALRRAEGSNGDKWIRYSDQVMWNSNFKKQLDNLLSDLPATV